MDELDLVRLARPPAPEPDDERLARLRADALGAEPDEPAGDASPTELDVVELPVAAPGGERRSTRWRLAAAGVAAAVLVAGGLALAASRRDDGGIAATADDVTLRRQLALAPWARTIEGAPQPADGGATTVSWGGSLLTFAAEDPGALTLETPCGIFVSRGYRITDGRLVLAEPLTSPEGGCTERTLQDATNELLAVLASTPTVELDGCTQTGDTPDRATLYCGALRLGDGEPFTRAVPDTGGTPTTIAGPHTPTLEELRSRRQFRLRTLTKDGQPIALDRPPEIAFGPGFRARTVCNQMNGTGVIANGRLRLTETFTTQVGCVDDVDVLALLTGAPTIELDGTTLRLATDRYVATFDELPGVPTSVPAGPHTPTIDELRGRTFRVTVLRKDMRALTLQRPPELRFGDRTSLTTECNGVDAVLSIVDGRLRVADWVQTLVGCPNENDVVLWLTGSPVVTLDGPSLRLTTPTYDAELLEIVDGAPATTTSIGLAPPSTTFTTVELLPVTVDRLAGHTYEGPGPAGTVRFSVDLGGIARVQYGCNSGSSRVDLENGRLVLEPLDRTEIACDPSEDAVYALFAGRPSIVVGSTIMQLTGEALTLSLRLVDDAPRPLAGAWQTDGAFTPQLTTYAGLAQTLVLDANGSWSYDGICFDRSGTYTVDGSTITFRLGPVPSSPGCGATPEQVDEERRLLALFDTTVNFAIAGEGLRLAGVDGSGELFRSTSPRTQVTTNP